MNKVYVRTFGCQMNERDSEVICGLLKKEGFEIVSEAEGADVVIFNTCAVRQNAEDRVWSWVGMFKKELQVTSHKSQVIGVVGCMAQSLKEKIFERAPGVDFVVGPLDIEKIPGIIKRVASNKSRYYTVGGQAQVTGKAWGQSPSGTVPKKRGQSPKGGDSPLVYEFKVWETDGTGRPDEIYQTGFYEHREHACVVISEGCSNFCSYCVVPYARGALRNRRHDEIIREIKEAVSKGITRFTLLGQNVNAFESNWGQSPSGTVPNFTTMPLAGKHKSQVSFVELLEIIDRIDGVKEFDFLTSHPKDTSIELFKAMAKANKLKKHLHLPVQSGSDAILKKMNRKYTRDFYLDLVKNYRKIVKGGGLSTDIIVGFPGETESDFKLTTDLMRKVKFDSAYIFKYSPRPHTEAQNMEDDVPRAEKERRHGIILEIQRGISRKK